MARLTDVQIMCINDMQKRAYAETNPAEGLRLMKPSMATAKYCGRKYAEYQKDKLLEVFLGKTIIPHIE